MSAVFMVITLKRVTNNTEIKNDQNILTVTLSQHSSVSNAWKMIAIELDADEAFM